MHPEKASRRATTPGPTPRPVRPSPRSGPSTVGSGHEDHHSMTGVGRAPAASNPSGRRPVDGPAGGAAHHVAKNAPSPRPGQPTTPNSPNSPLSAPTCNRTLWAWSR
jgi:hypothetical protein